MDTEGIFQQGQGSEVRGQGLVVDHTQLSPGRQTSFVEPSCFVVSTLTNYIAQLPCDGMALSPQKHRIRCKDAFWVVVFFWVSVLDKVSALNFAVEM